MTDVLAETILQRIYLGRLDADTDEELLKYFIDTGTAGQVLREGKYLVVGRKGSGKTALFTHLMAEKSSKFISLDLEEYVFDAHKGLRDSGVAEAFVYASSWRFAIVITAYLEVQGSLSWLDRRRGLHALRKIGVGPNKKALGALFDWLKRIKKADLPSISGVADLGGFELGDKDPTLMSRATSELLGQLEDLLVKAAKRGAFCVLLDRLDDAWVPANPQESEKLLIGAVKAARQLNNKIKQATGVPSVVIFLRSDLWDRLSFNDKNKTTQDLLSLDWTEADLERVIAHRIHKTAGVPEDQAWALTFSSEPMRQGTSARKFILKRTLGRPRDIVAFAIFAREAAIAAGHAIVEREDVYEAELRYSRHIVDELKDELGGHIDNFDAAISVLQSIGRRRFSKDEWDTAASKNGHDGKTARTMLALLFDTSAIGVYRQGGKQGGSRTAYRYENRYLAVEELQTIEVHLSLIKELRIKDR